MVSLFKINIFTKIFGDILNCHQTGTVFSMTNFEFWKTKLKLMARACAPLMSECLHVPNLMGASTRVLKWLFVHVAIAATPPPDICQLYLWLFLWLSITVITETFRWYFGDNLLPFGHRTWLVVKASVIETFNNEHTFVTKF